HVAVLVALSPGVAARLVFIGVVTQVQDEFQVIALSHVPVAAEEAGLVVRAAAHAETDGADIVARPRGGPGTPHPGGRLPLPQVGRETIKVCGRSEEHTSELQSRFDLVCRLLLEKKKTKNTIYCYCYLVLSFQKFTY